MPRLLKSINEQTADKDSFEVIFVDDCSSDNTIEVIQSTLNSDIHYQVHKLPVNSGGASIPRNLGIKLARGEYIIFIDSDDNIYPYSINDIINFVEKTNCDICYFQIHSTSNRLSAPPSTFRKGTVEDADVLHNRLTRVLGPWKCFRTSLIRIYDIHFPNMRSGEDRIFTLTCLSDAYKVSILADKYYYDLQISDEVGLTNGNGSFSKHEDMLQKHFIWFDIIFRSSREFSYKLKLFNAIMSFVFDELIKSKKIDNPDIVKLYVKRINSLGFFFVEDFIIFKEHRDAYNRKFKIFN